MCTFHSATLNQVSYILRRGPWIQDLIGCGLFVHLCWQSCRWFNFDWIICRTNKNTTLWLSHSFWWQNKCNNIGPTSHKVTEDRLYEKMQFQTGKLKPYWWREQITNGVWMVGISTWRILWHTISHRHKRKQQYVTIQAPQQWKMTTSGQFSSPMFPFKAPSGWVKDIKHKCKIRYILQNISAITTTHSLSKSV